jgi:cobalt-zinc-cadmium efflux system membrane fusion protein
MLSRIHLLFLGLAGSLPTVLVLGVLGTIAYWGHLHDWKIPRLAELMSGPPEEKETKVENKSAPEDGPNFDKPIQFKSAEAVTKTGLEFAVALERPMPEYVTAPGSVEYDHLHLAHLASPVAGTVWRVDKIHGQRVQKGTVLALLNAADVGKAKADLLQAQIRINLQAEVLKRLAQNSALVQERQIQEAQLSLREARFQRLAALQALANLGMTASAEGLDGLPDEELVKRVRFLGLPEELKPELEKETTSANLLPLCSPFDGVVAHHDIAVGEVVSTLHTQPLYTVADLREMWISLTVRVEDVGKLKTGQTLTFKPDQNVADPHSELYKVARWLPFSPLRDSLPPEGVKGIIEWISPEVDEKTRTVHLHAHVRNPGGQLRANGFGTGQVLIHEKPNALAVPMDAVQEDGGIPFVFVKVDETSFQPRKVQLGLRHGGYTEIESGIRPGEEVVTTGSHVLKAELFKSRLGSDD